MKDEPSKRPDHAHPIFTRQIGSAKARWKVHGYAAEDITPNNLQAARDYRPGWDPKNWDPNSWDDVVAARIAYDATLTKECGELVEIDDNWVAETKAYIKWARMREHANSKFPDFRSHNLAEFEFRKPG